MRWQVNLKFVWPMLVVMLVACVPSIATPTPSGPATLAASPTVLPFLPTNDEAASIGRSNPTSAAIVAEDDAIETSLFTPTALAPTAQFVPLQIFAADGTLLPVIFFGAPTRPAPMILLLSDSGEDSDVWVSGAQQFQAAGYNVYLLNLREVDNQVDGDWSVVVSDVQVVAQNALNATTINTGRIIVAGLGTGGNIALFTCGQLTGCTHSIAISPRPSIAGLNISVLPSLYNQGRSLLLMSADDDEGGSQAATEINTVLGGALNWQRYSNGGRGSQLLLNQPDIVQQILIEITP